MEIDTTLSASISAAGLKAAYDAACKRLLSEKIILAWIMRECLEEFRGYSAAEIAERFIEGTPQVSAVPLAPDGADGILRLLGTLLSDSTLPVEKKRVLRDEYEIPMTMKLEKEVSFMCNLSDGVWNKAWDKAWDKCAVQEHRKTVLSDLRSLMQNTGWTAEKCMDILNVPTENRREYAYELNKQ